jgi:hypothetical protein
MKVFSEVVYVDLFPEPPPSQMRIKLPMRTYWMDLKNSPEDLDAEWEERAGPLPIVFAKWLLCHLSDEEVLSLLNKLWGSKVQAFIVESTCKCSKSVCTLGDNLPFYERSTKAWRILFEPQFTVDVVRLEQEGNPTEPQSIMHLKPKEALDEHLAKEVQPVPKSKRKN